MNVLDENIPLDQRDLLRTWGVHCRVIGQDTAPISIGDDNILALLHRLCHPAYGLVWLDVAPEEAALFIRRVLRHPRFATKVSRMGSVIRAHHDGLQFWQKNRPAPHRAGWTATQ